VTYGILLVLIFGSLLSLGFQLDKAGSGWETVLVHWIDAGPPA